MTERTILIEKPQQGLHTHGSLKLETKDKSMILYCDGIDLIRNDKYYILRDIRGRVLSYLSKEKFVIEEWFQIPEKPIVEEQPV